MKRIISILICFSLVFTLSACSTQTGGDTASAPVISISKRLLAQDCYSDDGETLLLRYSDQVPGVAVSSADEAADKINEAINAISQNFAANDVEGSDLGIDNLLAVAKEHYASSPDSFTSYALERSFDVTRGDSSLLSIVFESYINSGGVHPNVVYTTANFSTVTGEKLSFSDLSENPDGLKTLCLNYIKGLITGGNYPPNTFNDGYESALSDLFADDLWYFSHEGLTFVANAYALASYAAGSFRFTVPYSEIHNQLKSEYLIPERAQSSGEISAAASQADGTLTGMVFDDAGEKILLSVKGNVYDVKLCSVNYNDYDGSFVSSGAALFYSDLISGQTISITASIPDTIPNLQLSWRTADGEEQKRLISQSGEDGSILLLDYEESLNLNPLEITQLLPYSVDLDGNGTE